MRRSALSAWRRLSRDESGNASIEFVIVVPLIFIIFMTAVELGIYSFRQMWLDRGLDIAMREVRINTGNAPSHDAMKQTICANAPFIPDCLNSLKLEMTPTEPRAFSALDAQPDCVDRLQTISSQEPPNYLTGKDHSLMLVRACVKFSPVFPMTGLGFEMVQSGDQAGQSIMTAMSAFVQEPDTTALTDEPIFTIDPTGPTEGGI